jgi:hypothetical protein
MITATDPTDRIPAEIERELVEADPRTCTECKSTMVTNDDDTLTCHTVDCPHAGRVWRIVTGMTDETWYAINDGWVS